MAVIEKQPPVCEPSVKIPAELVWQINEMNAVRSRSFPDRLLYYRVTPRSFPDGPANHCIACHLKKRSCCLMISAPLTNLRQHVGTGRGGALVQLQQAFSQSFGFLPIVALEKLLGF